MTTDKGSTDCKLTLTNKGCTLLLLLYFWRSHRLYSIYKIILPGTHIDWCGPLFSKLVKLNNVWTDKVRATNSFAANKRTDIRIRAGG